MVSFPDPPVTVSSPSPRSIVSLPPLPLTVSFPPEELIVSASAPPIRVSALELLSLDISIFASVSALKSRFA